MYQRRKADDGSTRGRSEKYENVAVAQSDGTYARFTKTTKPNRSDRPNARPCRNCIVTLFKTLTFLAALVLWLVLLSYLTTGNCTFGYELPPKEKLSWMAKGMPQKVFTLDELSQYDGSDDAKPIYIAIMGKVFDVSSSPSHYGKKGGYGFFAGRDGSRAFVTGCFKDHLTHDIRGLTESQIKDLNGWADFYATHKKYFQVGTVELPEATGPIPEDCNRKKKPA